MDQDLILLSRFLPPASTGTSNVSKHLSICVTFHMYHNYLCCKKCFFLCCNVAMSALIQKQGCTKTKKVGPSPAFPSATSKAESFEQSPELCPTLWASLAFLGNSSHFIPYSRIFGRCQAPSLPDSRCHQSIRQMKGRQAPTHHQGDFSHQQHTRRQQSSTSWCFAPLCDKTCVRRWGR